MEAAVQTASSHVAAIARDEGEPARAADAAALQRLVERIERAFARTGEYPATLASELLPLAEAAQDVRALALAHLGLVLESRRCSVVPDAPLQQARVAVRYAMQQSDPALRCRAHLLLAAFATCSRAGVAQAYEHAQITLGIADGLDDATHHARALVVLAETAHLCGDTLASRKLYEAALLSVDRTGKRSYSEVQTQWESHLALAHDLLSQVPDAASPRAGAALLARARSHAEASWRSAQHYRDPRARHRSSLWSCDAKYQAMAGGDALRPAALGPLSRAMAHHLQQFAPLPHERALRTLCVAQLAYRRGHPGLAWGLLQRPECAGGALQDAATAARWQSLATLCFPVGSEPQRYRAFAREQILGHRHAHWACTLARSAVQAKRAHVERLRAERFLADDLRASLATALRVLAPVPAGAAAMQEAAGHAVRLMEDALDAVSDYMAEARLDEHQVLAAAVADLQALAHDVVSELEPKAYARKVSIAIADGGRPAFVQGKYPALHRALFTLIDRAVRGARKGSEVRVALSPGRLRHVLRVEATGTLSADSLASARRIVRSHFGRLRVGARPVPGATLEWVEIVLPSVPASRRAACAAAGAGGAAVASADRCALDKVQRLVQDMDRVFADSGEYPAALARELLPLAEACGRDDALARAHMALCLDARRRGAAQATQPLEHARKAVRAARQQSDLSLRCHALLMVAGLCPPTPQGVADAYDHASQALAFADWLDDAACHATALLQLGHVAARCGEAPIAINCFEAAILNIERVKDRAYLVTHTRAQAHHALAKLTLQCAVVADTAPERRMLLERAREHAATALQHAHRFRDHRAVQRANLWCGDVLFQVLAQGDAPPREHLLLRLREMKRHLRGLNTAPSEVAARAMCLAQLAGLRGRDRLAWRILQTAARDPTPLEHDGVAARWLELAVRYFPVRDDPERYRGIVAAQAAARRRAASAYAHVSAQVQSKRIELERNRADQFLAHDLRSPLSSAVAALNEALSTQDGRALRPAIDLACAKLDRALQTIDSAALFTRLGEHEVLSAGTVSLLELAHEALCDVEPLAHRRGVAIRIARAEAAFTVGKRAALHRALVNLLNNAVQHSPTGGEVRVTLESGQGRHRVRIKDSGPGLHIDDRLARSLEHVSAGEMHGLGLASARRIVRSHFGRLVLRNDPGGVGAVAEVTLPATEPTALPHHQ